MNDIFVKAKIDCEKLKHMLNQKGELINMCIFLNDYIDVTWCNVISNSISNGDCLIYIIVKTKNKKYKLPCWFFKIKNDIWFYPLHKELFKLVVECVNESLISELGMKINKYQIMFCKYGKLQVSPLSMDDNLDDNIQTFVSFFF